MVVWVKWCGCCGVGVVRVGKDSDFENKKYF